MNLEKLLKRVREHTEKVLAWRSDDFGHSVHALMEAESRELQTVGEWALRLCEINEVMRDALTWNANTICLDDIYKQDNNEHNKINLLRNIREAHEALAKVEQIASEGK